MKKTFFSFILIFGIANCYSQQIVENKIDEFTNQSVIRTKFEYLQDGFNPLIAFSLKKVDTTRILYLAIVLRDQQIFSIFENDELMLKLSNGEVVTLKNFDYKITSTGGANTGRFVGSQANGLTAVYFINDSSFNKLISSDLEKIRLYTSKDYLDISLKEKKRGLLRNCLVLIK